MQQWAAQRSGRTKQSFSRMNVIMFVTDQERAIQHFPPGWAEQNLPGMTTLMKHGVTFVNGFCNACMCSPSRATLVTGYFPAQHGVKYTLEEDMPAPEYSSGAAPPGFQEHCVGHVRRGI